MTALPTDIGRRLASFRVEAGLTQSKVAIKISIDQSRISRIEKGEVSPNFIEVKEYLEAIATDATHDYIRYLEKEWRILPPPAPETPELENIWIVEQKLKALEDFVQEKDLPGPVQAEVDMHRQSLWDAAAFLSCLDHQIAFIGDIGVGKTTALCLAAGLVLPESKTGLDGKVALETGAGRITVCEVRIKAGSTWGVTIEPQQEAEIYRLVADLCEGVKSKDTVRDSEADSKGVPREIERVLRNMSKLTRKLQKKPDGKRMVQDPLKELAQKLDTLDELLSEFSSRLQLWKRTTRELWWDENSNRAPLEWLRDIFIKVNNGRLENVSLPQRIDIIAPRSALEKDTFNIGFIDTRGVDGTVVRPDLKACLDDPRTLTILCSTFRAAPDATMRSLIEHALDTGSERALSERVALLVLPHPGDAIEMKDEATGEKVDSEADGYELKAEDVHTKLEGLGVKDIPVLFFNATSDWVEDLRDELAIEVRRVRRAHTERISSLAGTVDGLITNYEIEAAVLVRREAENRLRIFADQNQSLPERLQPVHDQLVSALRTIHPRTVWATTRRSGSWYNLDVFYYLGTGAASEAKRRSDPAIFGLEEVIKNMLGDIGLQAAHGFLDEVRIKIKEWSERFVQVARRAGEEAFRSALESDTVLWSECENRWGRGSGYRNDVADLVRDWFLATERNGLHSSLERRVRTAWETEVLQPLSSLYESMS